MSLKEKLIELKNKLSTSELLFAIEFENDEEIEETKTNVTFDDIELSKQQTNIVHTKTLHK